MVSSHRQHSDTSSESQKTRWKTKCLFIQTLQDPIFPLLQHLNAPLLAPEDARPSRMSSPNRSRDLKQIGHVALCLQPPTQEQKEFASCPKAKLCWIYHFTCWKGTKSRIKRAEQTRMNGGQASLPCVTSHGSLSVFIRACRPIDLAVAKKRRDERNGRTKKKHHKLFWHVSHTAVVSK